MLNNSFEAVLRNQRRGALLQELSEELQRLTASVREHGKGGSVTLVIKVSPANGDASAMSVIDEVRVKVPQAKRPNSLFYATDDGRLVREDPNQKEMVLKVAEAPPVAEEPVKLAQVG